MKPELPVGYNPNSFFTSQQPFLRRLLMDKYIGFDVDDKKTIARMIEKGSPEPD